MSKPDEIVSMIRAAEDIFGVVDVLVSNAGIQTVEPVETFAPERWDLIVAINMNSAFHTTRAALPGMKRRGWGRIINISYYTFLDRVDQPLWRLIHLDRTDNIGAILGPDRQVSLDESGCAIGKFDFISRSKANARPRKCKPRSGATAS